MNEQTYDSGDGSGPLLELLEVHGLLQGGGGDSVVAVVEQTGPRGGDPGRHKERGDVKISGHVVTIMAHV